MATIKEVREEAMRKLNEGTALLMKAHSLIGEAKTILNAHVI